MGMKLKVAAVAFAVPLLGCSGIDVDGANGVDEEVGQQFQSLDASCTLNISQVSYGDTVPPIGGEIWTSAYGRCQDRSSLEYRATAKNPKNESLTLSDWAAGIGFYPLPPGSPEGTYTVTVAARRLGTTETVARDARKLVIGRACDHAVLQATPAATTPGESVELTPDINCPEGIAPEWRVTVDKPGGGSISLPWVQGSSTIWDTTGLSAGTATLTLAVRTLGNTVADLSVKQTYVLGEVCTAGTLVAKGTGTTRTLTATSSCLGGGTPVYRFSSVAPDGRVSILRDFGANAAVAWNVTGLNGTFTARVDVRAAESPEQLVSSKSTKVSLGDACTKLTLASLWGTYSTADSLVANAKPNCGLAEVQFQRRPATSSAWSTVCAYSPAKTCDLALASQGPGDYVVRALVRKQGSSAAYDVASASSDFIVTDGRPLLRSLPLPDSNSQSITNVSADGRWFAGMGSGMFRWSRAKGFTKLGVLPAYPQGSGSFRTTGISDDGAVVVGWCTGEHAWEPFRWKSRTTTSLIPGSAYEQIASSTSSSGDVVVGQLRSSLGSEAFRWTAAGLVALGDLPGGGLNSGAEDVSGDGSVVVGQGESAEGLRAFRWTAATGMVSLGVVPGEAKSSARSVSQDGSVVVGAGDRHAVRWTAAEGMVNLGSLQGGPSPSYATGVSADGSKVVGMSGGPRQQEPFLWTAATGMRRLIDVLADRGVDVAGWELLSATDISADGKTIVGNGRLDERDYVGWILTDTTDTTDTTTSVGSGGGTTDTTTSAGTGGGSSDSSSTTSAGTGGGSSDSTSTTGSSCAGSGCTSECPCSIGEGECSSDDECAPGLVCTTAAVAKLGFTGGTKSCMPAHCDNDALDDDLGETSQDCGGECGCRASYEEIEFVGVPAGIKHVGFNDLSADGSTLVGTALGAKPIPYWPVTTAAASGSVTFLENHGASGFGYFISDDGSIITGSLACADPPACNNAADAPVRWVGDAAPVRYPFGLSATGMSGSGNVVVYMGVGPFRAYRLVVSTGSLTNSPLLGAPFGISGNGEVVYGEHVDNRQLAVWYTATDEVWSPPFPSEWSTSWQNTAMSQDGSVLVGNALIWIGTEYHYIPYICQDQSFELVEIADDRLFDVHPLDLSADGTRFVGLAVNEDTGSQEAVFWDEAGGVRTLYDELVARGLEFPIDMTQIDPAGFISGNGRVIVSMGTHDLEPYWRVVLSD